MSEMGASKIPFRFTQSSQSSSEQSLMPEHQQDHPAHEDQTCYYIHIRMSLGEGQGDKTPPSHAWSALLIADMFQEGLEEQINRAVVLAPGEAILFLDNNPTRKGSPWEMPGM